MYDKDEIIELRKRLHAFPELSGREIKTAAFIDKYIRNKTGFKTYNIDGSLIAVYSPDSERRAPTAFRAELDAVPVEEAGGLSYASKNPGAAHKCGHDGHMAALLAFMLAAAEDKPKRKIYFIFQKAEETGEGAKSLGEYIKNSDISEIYAFHNIPGYPAGTCLFKDGCFACASCGLRIELIGKTNHAAFPGQKYSPARTVGRLIASLDALAEKAGGGRLIDYTATGIDLNFISCGVAPGGCELNLTLRAEYEDDLNMFIDLIKAAAAEFAAEDEIGIETSILDPFPETVNSGECIQTLKAALERCGVPSIELGEPMRWSEDFGHYTKLIPGAIFGIGSGESCPALHTPEYDFPDEIIDVAVKIFKEIARIDRE